MSAEDFVKRLSLGEKAKAYSADDAHADAMSRGAKCKQCPLFNTKSGPVKGEIRPNGRLTIIGEAPGRVEVEQGKVFAWKSGEVLENALNDGGLTRADCSIVNVLECRPPKDVDLRDYVERIRRTNRNNITAGGTGDGLLDPITACSQRLLNDVKAAKSNYLLAVGGKALELVAKMHGLPYGDKHAPRKGLPFVATIMNQHGAPVVADTANGRVHILSALHPAFAMREHRYVPDVHRAIARAARIAVRGSVAWDEPETITFPEFGDLSTLFGLLRKSPRLSVDIESDSADTMRCRIRCIGIGGLIPGHEKYDKKPLIVTVPFRWSNGSPSWPAMQQERVREMVRELLDAVPLVFHNAPFDVMVLTRENFLSRDARLSGSYMRKHDDTLLMDKNSTASGMPHGLGDAARRRYECRLWKYDVDHKAADGLDNDATLHEYNGYDIAVTDALSRDVEREVIACGTTQAYEVDKTLSVIAREMTRMGITVCEQRRGRLSQLYNRESGRLLRAFKELAGPKLNPRSVPQMRHWLYHDLKLEPVLNTDNKPYKDGDDPGTGIPALFALREQLKERDKRGGSSDNKSALAVDLALAFRTCETVRGRYVDKLRVHYDDPDRDLSAFGMLDPVVVRNLDGQVVESLPRRPAMSIAHPVWNIGTIPTGRWSSKPNWQNAGARAWAVDVRGLTDAPVWSPEYYEAERVKITPAWHVPVNLRQLFRAAPGHVLVGADWDQVELRLFAVISEDEMLFETYAKGLDTHTWNLASLLSKHVDEIPKIYEDLLVMKKSDSEETRNKLKYLRTCAKRFVFLIIYGGHVNMMFQTMSADRDKATNERTFKNLSKAQCQEWYDRWHKIHPNTLRWHVKVTDFLKKNGYVEDALHHRRRFYPNNESADTSHINHVIQAHSAAMANNGVIRISDAIPFQSWSPWSGLQLQVHDQLVAQVPIERAEEGKKIIEEAMYHEFNGMKFKASAVASADWAKQDV